ncbi:MAG: endo-1,4-beta-xylanase [Oscillospiraceae bacterium]|nr:endo-1,4-beta-xylanase [Oscillospiraceae bacterium]
MEKITLKQAYKNYFDIGVAINPGVLEYGHELIKAEFSGITCENEMKPASVQPERNRFTFEKADMLADFAAENNLKIRGHTLVWHNQTGEWMYKDSNKNNLPKEILYSYMQEHIDTVVKRYAGKIYCWDVVNEAVSDIDGEYLREKSPYFEIAGSEEFIEKAFVYAHEADPGALLFYNDYDTENPEKREKIYKLLKSLKDKNIPVHGVGLQAHYDIYFDVGELQKSIDLFSSLGLIIHITELDVSVYKFDERGVDFETLPEDRLKTQTELYSQIFAVLRENKDKIGGVTFWGLDDKASWLNGFPVKRTNHPLLFGRDGKPKEAYGRVTGF